jgi:hypothetical protein
MAGEVAELACRALLVRLGQRPALRFSGEPVTEIACDHAAS